MSTIHPRRSTANIMSTSPTALALAKGATFQSPPTTPSTDASIPALPQRAETTLEDVVDAHRRRIEVALTDIDRSFAGISLEDKSPSALKASALPAAVVPTLAKSAEGPYGPILGGVTDREGAMVGCQASPLGIQRRSSSRSSTSNIATSIDTGMRRKLAETPPTSANDDGHAKSVKPSAITRSVATSGASDHLARLSAKASNRIREHVLGPLLAKPSLKEFQDIVRDCPRRIHAKDIVCLRDLEKTLVFLAPSKAKSAASYLDFCVTTIQCIQATVEYLNERERTRPTDRPYTSGYFVDLVDQIKHYAQQVQEVQDKLDKGEKLDDLDAERSDEIKLFGGLSTNGRPAELVRVKKNGKAISIATGNLVDLDEHSKPAPFKRYMSAGLEDDEEVIRSMARRKRSATATELVPKRCREPGCDKEFKRPCDLTKHEKTHSRPWKCPVETCKYHEYGWPTEKEMDRHHNDKHSAAPPLYACHFKPCPYRSKRESNCKQHMEKAHGWQYVRSKNNGKQRDSDMHSLPTPQLTNVHTPSSDGNMADTPSDDGMGGYDSSHGYRSGALFPTCQPGSELDYYVPHTAQINLSPVSDRSQSVSSSQHSPAYVPQGAGVQAPFNDASHGYQNNNLDWNMYEHEDLYNAQVRLPPMTHPEVFKQVQPSYATSGVPLQSIPAPHISDVDHDQHPMGYHPADYRPRYHSSDMLQKPNHLHHYYPSGSASVSPPSTPAEVLLSGAGVSQAFSQSGVMAHQNHAFPAVSAQELLDFYALSTASVIAHGGNGMPWPMDDHFGGYRAM